MDFHLNSSGFIMNERDRRATERYETNGMAVLIEWIDGEACRTVPASLQDISMRGALVEAESALRPGTSVLIRPAGDLAADKVKASVVGISRVRRSRFLIFRPSKEVYRISLKFKGVCQYEFFKAAIDGFFVESCVIERPDTRFDSRDWR